VANSEHPVNVMAAMPSIEMAAPRRPRQCPPAVRRDAIAGADHSDSTAVLGIVFGRA
jgi:hypothetical protein